MSVLCPQAARRTPVLLRRPPRRQVDERPALLRLRHRHGCDGAGEEHGARALVQRVLRRSESVMKFINAKTFLHNVVKVPLTCGREGFLKAERLVGAGEA